MKKRIISLLLVLILCLSLLPATALAAEKTVSTKDELNTALSGSADTIKLTKDISLSAPITVSRTVTIDLNGHNLINLSSPSSVIVIESDGDLTLTDSNSTATNSLPMAPTGGVIMGTTNQSNTGGGITVKGTLMMRGGTVFSSQANLPENSGGRAAGGIFIAEGGTATIYGGCISDCFTNGNGYIVAGGIFVDYGAQLSMLSGSVVQNCRGVVNKGTEKDQIYLTRTTSASGVYVASNYRGYMFGQGGSTLKYGKAYFVGSVVLRNCTTLDGKPAPALVNDGETEILNTSVRIDGIENATENINYAKGHFRGYEANVTEGYTATGVGRVEFSTNGIFVFATVATQICCNLPPKEVTITSQTYDFMGWYNGTTKYTFADAIRPYSPTLYLNAGLKPKDTSKAMPVPTEGGLVAALAAGNEKIQLTRDITLTKTLEIKNLNVTLDLNGYVLKGDLKQLNNSTLTLIDSRPTATHGSDPSLPKGGVIKGNITMTHDGHYAPCTLIGNGGSIVGAVWMNTGGATIKNTDTLAVTHFYGTVQSYGTVAGGIYYGELKPFAGHTKPIISGQTVTFQSLPGTTYAIGVYPSGAVQQSPVNPTRAGYNFGSWLEGSSVYTFAGSNEDHTVTATWVCSHADKTHVDAQPSTCTEHGWYAYDRCNNCGRYYYQIGDTQYSSENKPQRDLARHTSTGSNCATCLRRAICDNCRKPYGTTTQHDFTGDYTWNDNFCLQKCKTEGCTKMFQRGYHQFDNDADAECNRCGYTRSVEGGVHTHDWSEAWEKNDTHHWHNCSASGCTVTDNSEKDGYALHSYGADGKCICGAEHAHDWSEDWEKNGTHHWHECTANGCTVTDDSEKDGYAAHEFDADGNCACGATHTHNWSSSWASTSSHHWHVCTVAGCYLTSSTDMGSYAAHEFDADGNCVCGATRPNELVPPSSYTVTYAPGPNAKETASQTDTKTPGEALTLKDAIFTREGYAQDGWCTLDDDGSYVYAYGLGGSYTADADVTLYPAWVKIVTLEIPFTIQVGKDGSATPPAKTFDLEMIENKELGSGSASVLISGFSRTTNGVGSYSGTLTFTGASYDINTVCAGCLIRQKSGSDAGWTYDDQVWSIELRGYFDTDGSFYSASPRALGDGSGAAEPSVFISKMVWIPPQEHESGELIPGRYEPEDPDDSTSYPMVYSNSYKGYTVTWNANGGTVDTAGATLTAPVDTVITPPTAAPQKASDANYTYSFDGWYTEPTGGDKVTFGTLKLTGDKTYYAHYTPTTRKYTVTVTNGTGGGSYAAATAVSIQANAPESGKRFIGWDGLSGLTITSGSETAQNVTFTMPARDVQASALYEDIQNPNPPATGHTVSFDPNGGSGEMASATNVSGAYTLPTTTTFTAPAGKRFKGWAERADGAVITTTTIDVTADKTLYAIWESDEQNPNPPATGYTVSFDPNGGSGEMASATNVSGAYTLPTTTTFTAPTGKRFKGWAESANGAVITTTTIDVTADKTLYAIWESDEQNPNPPATGYTVSFDPNGGSGEMASATNVSGAYTLPTTTTFTAPAGKRFKGWAESANGAVITTTTIDVTADKTLYAVWESDGQNPNPPATGYTVSFDPNGGSGEMASATNVSGAYTLPTTTTFTAPTGKRFKGWAESANGAVITTTTIDVTADKTLYAIWESDEQNPNPPVTGYKVIVETDGNGTAAAAPSTNIAVGTVVTLFADANTGFRFKEWQVLSGSVTIANNRFTMPAGDVKVKAVFERILLPGVRPNSKPAKQEGSSAPDGLNSTDHIAYVQGYTDDTVRPNAPITRAETAMMLYRLLTDARRDEIETKRHSFTDIPADAWYRTAVATMANGGYITGYADGSFGGDRNITRAEFIVILVRFIGIQNARCSFTDVPRDHWAYRCIATAAEAGWITGAGGAFRPDDAITRAEAMAIINRVLERGVDENSKLPDFHRFSDNVPGKWYYYEVIEASNGHDYTGRRPSEDWTALHQ